MEEKLKQEMKNIEVSNVNGNGLEYSSNKEAGAIIIYADENQLINQDAHVNQLGQPLRADVSPAGQVGQLRAEVSSEEQKGQKILNKLEDKNKKEKSGMVNNNWLIPYELSNKWKYLNVSVYYLDGHGRIAEWLTQFADTERPSGHAGSIPAPAVTDFLIKLVIIKNVNFNHENYSNRSNQIIKLVIEDKKSGHQKMQNPITLCLVASPGNSYNYFKLIQYITFSNNEEMKNINIQENQMLLRRLQNTM